MNYINFMILSIVWILAGLYLTYDTTEKGLHFKSYNKEDWGNLIIDVIIALPLYIKLLFNVIFLIIEEIWITLKHRE